MAQNRVNKINEEVKRELSEVIRTLKDTRIPVMTSVIAVHVTPDLRYAKAYISVLGEEEVQKKAIEGLKSAAGYVRREIGHRLQLRYAPEFIFELDHSIEHAAHINQIISDISKKEE